MVTKALFQIKIHGYKKILIFGFTKICYFFWVTEDQGILSVHFFQDGVRGI